MMSLPSTSMTPEPSSGFYPLMQTNGRRVYGPPEDWVGPPPSSACELYVRRIPKSISEQKILEPFLRFGKLYQFRIPIDFVQGNRGYAYARYTNEEDAGCAMEVLNHYFIEPMKTMDIVNSCEKCRLFVSNIPKHISEKEIEQKLRTVFPSLQRIYSKGPPSGNDGNIGFVFVNFGSHSDALEAKKNTCPGIIRMWGQDLKVVWANSESSDQSSSNQTLFIRNVDLKLNNRDLIELMVNYVPRTTIRKISKVRTNAFVDFTCREAAETILRKMEGVMACGSRLVIEWAKPSAVQSLHRMRNTDFDSILRLKCIANMWGIPVIIFGTYFEVEDIQYAAVMLRNKDCPCRFIIVTLQCNELVDIHSRLCEVVVGLIDKLGGFPDCNYVFHTNKDQAHMIGMMVMNPQITFIAAHRVPSKISLDQTEIGDLTWACITLSKSSEDLLIDYYKKSFQINRVHTFLNGWMFGQRLFGTIMPKYRNKLPLKFNLNDTQIVLALCYQPTGSNIIFPGRVYKPWEVSTIDFGYTGLPYIVLTLLPLSLTQSRFATNHVLNHVVFGRYNFVHPAQQFITPPLIITGCSYAQSIKQPTSNTSSYMTIEAKKDESKN